MIVYVSSLEGLTAAELRGFFAGWPKPPTAAVHLKILRQSDHVVLARDVQAARVAGFITALTDGVLAAYIPLLEVLPAYRGRGIGRELVRRMFARLAGLYMIDLVCDPSLQPFYASLGMQPYTAMMIRNFAGQAGRITADDSESSKSSNIDP